MTDYPRIGYEYQRHHERFVRYVKRCGLPCQECRGRGGEVVPVTTYGQGPWETCGYCEGTGMTSRWLRGEWLRWKRETVRSKR